MSSTPLALDAVHALVARHKTAMTEEDVKKAEDFLIDYGKKLAAEGNIAGLEELMVVARPLYEVLGKAKSAKLIRELVELCLSIDQPPKEKTSLVEKCIQWATDNCRIFLRRTLQARLIRLLNEQSKFVDAIKIAEPLESELKKLEDRELLIEVALEESRSAFALKNLAKSKTALVLAKTSSNGSFVSSAMQASIDLQSGILYSADEQDFKTAYSYFYEALEGFQLSGDKICATRALKYMCLSKIMSNDADQIPQLLANKMCSGVKGRQIDAVVEMADAFKKRCLKSFQLCMNTYKEELMQDQVVAAHSTRLSNDMMEKEITRCLEPYSEVFLSHIAKKVNLPQQHVEKVIAMMILDQKIYGCIDQHRGSVKIFQPPSADKTLTKGIELHKALNKAVEAAYSRAAGIR